MKLIKQSKLVFFAGRTQKIYEIDLCEVGAGRYVVNFRYGRRDGAIKDGSKTAMPVGLSEAEAIFTKLEESKLRASYVPEGSAAPPRASAAPSSAGATRGGTPSSSSAGDVRRRVVASAAPSRPSGSSSRTAWTGSRSSDRDAQERAVLARLVRGEVHLTRAQRRAQRRGGGGAAWSLGRVIWRAGELKIQAAESELLHLLRGGDSVRTYSTVWALGFCGGRAAIQELERRAQHNLEAPLARQIDESLRKLYQRHDAAALASFVDAKINALPAKLAACVRAEDVEGLKEALGEHLAGTVASRYEVLETLYLVDTPVARAVLLDEVRRLPMRPPWFQRVRHLFKAAEFRRDGQMFGALAYRFAKERAMYEGTRWGARVDGRWFNQTQLQQELGKSNARVAYGSKTREYFRRRVWRTLKRLGDLGDPEYVKMAVGVLLPYVDDDGGREQARTHYGWRNTRRVRWPRFAAYLAFHHILHGGGRRLELRPGTKAWRYRASSGDTGASTAREESYPHLWEQQPAGLLHLLDESRCEEVHRFAVKVVRDLTGLTRSLDVGTVCMLLQAPYSVTVELGAELGQGLYDPVKPQRALVLAMLDCGLQSARRAAQRWVESAQSVFLSDGAFLARVITSRWEDTRALGRRLVRGAVLPDDVARSLVDELVALMLSLGAGDAAKAADIGETIARGFAPQMLALGVPLVQRLLGHALEGVQSLGAEILLARRELPPVSVLQLLMRSGFATTRAAAIRLVSQQTDSLLLGRPDLMLGLLVSPQADVREAARPLLRRLSMASGDFARLIAGELLDVLPEAKAPEDVVFFVAQVLRGELLGSLREVSPEKVWRLIRAKAGAAQEIGGLLLPKLDAATMTMEQVVTLAGHEILALREASWRICEQNLDKVRAEIFVATRMLDVRWSDTQQFAYTFFKEKLSPEDFTPAALVSVCDSVKPAVQRLGQELVMLHFRQEHGPEYMLKLSEHPSASVQLFVTNYLASYAAGKPEHLAQLAPYFVRTLSRVNQGGVAKQRIMDFLCKEGVGSQEAARVVVPIMERVSASMAVQTRAGALEAMVRIVQRFPEVETPLVRVPLVEKSALVAEGAA